MTTQLLYNLTAFMRPDLPLSVEFRKARHETWPVLIKFGPGGDDTIDLFSSVEDATRLRDALTAAIDQVDA